MLVSFVIPAHNEAAHIAACVASIRASAAAARAGDSPVEPEIIVADDASTDATGSIAASLGCRVVRVECRHIAATRNAGAAASTAPIIFFIDADTRLTPEAFAEALAALRDAHDERGSVERGGNGGMGGMGGRGGRGGRGCVAGGGPVRFDGTIPLYAHALLHTCLLWFRLARFTGGCFFYVTRDALTHVGGWPESVYAGEEVQLALALHKAYGRRRFHVTRAPVITSGRKLRTHSAREILAPFLRVIRRGVRGATASREGLDLWYAPRRQDPHKPQS